MDTTSWEGGGGKEEKEGNPSFTSIPFNGSGFVRCCSGIVGCLINNTSKMMYGSAFNLSRNFL